MDRVHEPVDRERRRSMVDHGHRLGGGSPENGRNGVPVRGTSPQLRKNGEGMAVSLTGCKRGRRRVGHDRVTVGNNRRRRRSVEWALRTRKQAIEGEVSVVMAEGSSSSFYSGRGGHNVAGEGETAGGNSLNAIDGRRLDEGLRSEIKGGGIKAWSEDLAWHLEVGGRAARGGRRRREEVATVGRLERKMKLIARAHLTERRE
jgi:hypothetical protein